MQTYEGLKRAWKGYKYAIKDEDTDLAQIYASRIQKMQRQLGVRVSNFPFLRMDSAGEEENLANYLANEIKGDEFIIEDEEPEPEDPLYAYKD